MCSSDTKSSTSEKRPPLLVPPLSAALRVLHRSHTLFLHSRLSRGGLGKRSEPNIRCTPRRARGTATLATKLSWPACLATSRRAPRRGGLCHVTQSSSRHLNVLAPVKERLQQVGLLAHSSASRERSSRGGCATVWPPSGLHLPDLAAKTQVFVHNTHGVERQQVCSTLLGTLLETLLDLDRVQHRVDSHAVALWIDFFLFVDSAGARTPERHAASGLYEWSEMSSEATASSLSGIRITCEPPVLALLCKAASLNSLSTELRAAAELSAGSASVSWRLLLSVCTALRREGTCSPRLHVLARRGLLLPRPSSAPPRSASLEQRVGTLRIQAAESAYQALVSDVTRAEKAERERVPLSSTARDVGFGLHVVTLMAACFLGAYLVGRRLFSDTGHQLACGCVGLLLSLVVETLLVVIRAS